MGLCARRVVRAIIVTSTGAVVTGNNNCANQQEVCPRAHMKGGEGYEVCHSVCGQPFHAEIDAINNALDKGLDLTGAVMVIAGHTHSCENCLKEMTRHGISNISFLTLDLEEW